MWWYVQGQKISDLRNVTVNSRIKIDSSRSNSSSMIIKILVELKEMAEVLISASMSRGVENSKADSWNTLVWPAWGLFCEWEEEFFCWTSSSWYLRVQTFSKVTHNDFFIFIFYSPYYLQLHKSKDGCSLSISSFLIFVVRNKDGSTYRII